MTAGRWVWVAAAAVALSGVWGFSPPSASAQDALDMLSDTSDPVVPFLIEPVLAPTSLRLQTHYLPFSVGEIDYFQVPLRFMGNWKFSESVTGEATWPFLLTFPSEGDTGFDIGNPRVGMEWPIVNADGSRHRVTISFDMYLPFAQIARDDDERDSLDQPKPSESVEGLVRRSRYAVALGALPVWTPDLLPEAFSPTLGLHYRLRQGKFNTQVSFDVPLMLGFDFSEPTFFHRHDTALRYGFALGFDARPIFPTLELAGVTGFFGKETSTALLANLGFRGAFGQVEPGLAVTYPIILGDPFEDSMERSVYISFDIAYRFQ